ncbi:hypothetical protein KY362_02590 [Candidatus Woesearchaeota archaeon]|nr:hypothetical protein [Candidatus Woesearchaeota archaeon]
MQMPSRAEPECALKQRSESEEGYQGAEIIHLPLARKIAAEPIMLLPRYASVDSRLYSDETRADIARTLNSPGYDPEQQCILSPASLAYHREDGFEFLERVYVEANGITRLAAELHERYGHLEGAHDRNFLLFYENFFEPSMDGGTYMHVLVRTAIPEKSKLERAIERSQRV